MKHDTLDYLFSSCYRYHTRMRIVVIYDAIVLRLCLLFSRILIDYEKNENKTPSKIYTITVVNLQHLCHLLVSGLGF